MRQVSSFGAWLKRRRKALDLTQEALARLVGCSVVSIRKIEADEQRPSRQIAERLAQHLQIAPDEQATFVQFARFGLDEVPPALPIPTAAQLPQAPPQNHRDFLVAAHVASDAHAARPSGTVTFLFTDIEGSTQLWEHTPEAMRRALARHDQIMSEAIAAAGGYAYKTIGDAFQAAFAIAAAALNAAIAAQRALAAEDWGAIGPVRVRMALDSGVVEERGDDYVGSLLNRTARLMAAGHGGQILLSAAAHELVWNQLPAGVSLRDLGIHLLKDITRPEHVFQMVASDLPSDFPPLKTKSPGASAAAVIHRRLPPALTPFIGRNHELGDLVARLGDPDARLVTLVAPGGMGKTRLALAAAEQLLHAEAFPDGVAFAALAPLGDPAGLDPTLADALGLPLDAGGRRSPRVQLLDYLREKELLLVLDNCEHLRDHLADLAITILTEAPGVILLATSRERLGLRAERISPLDGMVTEIDGVALFALTAQAVQPAFVLDNMTRPQVAAICAQVGGMPLAIELAAGWADALSLAEIAAELEQGDELLVSQAADLAPRHRSVRAVCDATWARLMPQEQAVFAQVAVFRGGGTRRALQAVTGASLGQLHALVGKALLRYDPERERYAVHELLHQYAEEQLSADPVAEQGAHARHATYYLEALAAREVELKGAGQCEALDRIGRDIENVHAAWGWAVAEGRADLLAQAAVSLGRFLEWQGRHEEGLAAFTQASEGLTRRRDPDMCAALVLTLAWCAAFHRALGQRDAARQALDRAEMVLAESVKPAGTRVALEALLTLQRGHTLVSSDFPTAHTAYTRSLQAARASDDHWMEAQALSGLGEAYHHLVNDFAEAARCWQACLGLQRAHADRLGAIATLAALSMNARYRGQVHEALALAQESYDLACRIGTPVQRANAASHLGFSYMWLAQDAAAIPFLEEALRLETEFGSQDQRGHALIALGAAVANDGHYARAYDLLEAGLTISRHTGNTINEHPALHMLFATALGAKDYDRGRRYRSEGIPVMRKRGAHYHLSLMLALDAMLERQIGDRLHARRLCLAALHEAMTYRIWLGLIATLPCVAILLADEGAVERAVELIALTEHERDVPRTPLSRDIFWTEIEALFAMLPADVAAAARERGRQRDFWATGQELLAELAAAGWGEG